MEKEYKGTSSFGIADFVTEVYDDNFIGRAQRKKKEVVFEQLGYTIHSEEKIKEWNAGQACCLAFIFLPLAFIKVKKVKVTYATNTKKNEGANS